MYLQLAENLSAQRVHVKGYKRKANVLEHTRKFPLSEQPEHNPYIFIPDFEAGAGGIFVREDKFDYLPAEQFYLFMKLLAPYQPNPEGLNEDIFLAGFVKNFFKGREDRKNGREERRNKRAESKGRAREARANAKVIKAEKGGASPLDSIIEGAKSIFGKKEDESTDTVTPGAPEKKPFYTNPLFLIGAVAVVGGGIYFATKKK